MPSRRHVEKMRTAISPRFATKSFRPALTAREPILREQDDEERPRASAAPPEQRRSTQASGSTEYAPSESARSTARARIAPSPNIASDAIAYPAPSAMYGQVALSMSCGTSPPTASAAVAAAIPERHHASQVRSAARRVRRVTSTNSPSLIA